jgi:hypothetical protein
MMAKWIALMFTLLAAATPATDGLNISLRGTTRTKAGIQFLVLIENLGPSSVFLEETREGSRDPYAINLEQIQTDSSWVSIGPRRDIPAAAVFELKPGTEIEKTITVTDPYVDVRSSPQKRYPIKGRHRASIRYFLSRSDWSDSIRNFRQKSRLAYSRSITIGHEAGVDQ